MQGSEIRKRFLEYFETHGHKLVKSGSLVPQDDPTLLFTNAGMNQFKRVFLGEEKRDYARATTAQKCVRAGGKHNDLENVGYTARHHTFFEMLGNFSFGDYFKEEAVTYAWDVLTHVFKLPVDKLWVSVYEQDDEAYNLWRDKIGVSADRLIRLGEKDNFWQMGDTGPCGPCSEILIDRGPEFGCDKPDCAAGCDCDRYLEIWNLVFMQYDRTADGVLHPLPKPSIDTGMGLERIAAVLQNTPTNYETDLLLPIIQQVEELAKKRYGQNAENDVAMKVIADHSRATAFLIGDGVMPSNEGRGYVLRRIMRRAMRYGRQLGLADPFMGETCQAVFEIMQTAYPEMAENAAFIKNVVKNEEERFSKTLDTGLKLLNDTLDDLRTAGAKAVSGDILFKLYDTYGFPLDIVKDVAGANFSLDETGFAEAMAAQKAQSRKKVAFEAANEAYKSLNFTTDQMPKFMGYNQLTAAAEIILLVVDGKAVDTVAAGAEAELIASQTPFYAEGGGQLGDSGMLDTDSSAAQVLNTIKDPTGLIIHKIKVTKGLLKKGDQLRMYVDTIKRKEIAANHTATHILHSVLGEVLGDHVKQAGSLVEAERLRFDFAHFAAVTTAELAKIESLVNQHIRDNELIDTCMMSNDEAISSGATALFGEKYGDTVRVVSVGAYSRELCGGTHTQQAGDIGYFKITGEASVAAGIRRIEAVTGKYAVDYAQQHFAALNTAANALKEKPLNVASRIEKLQADVKAAQNEVAKLKNAVNIESAGDVRSEAVDVNGVMVLVKEVTAQDPAQLREMADRFKDALKSGVVVLGAVADGKAMLIASVTNDLTGKFHAGNIVKEIAALVDGRGGGRADMAQAGGANPNGLKDALAKALRLMGN